MSTYSLSIDLSRLPKRYVHVAREGESTPSDYTQFATFEHGEDDDSLPKASVSHVIYHHVQEALYFVKDHVTDYEEGFWPENITDMANVVIEMADLVPVTGVTVAPTTASIVVGATRQLTPTVAPAGANNKNVTYSTSDATKATVSSTGLVTAVAEGTATITVKTLDGDKTATCAVTVTAA